MTVSVLPVPAFLLAKACVKFAVSPPTRLPEVIVGTPVEDVVPSYPFESVAAVTVIARAVIAPVVLLANVTA